MKQIIQYQKTGEITVEELPIPQLKDNGVLVRNVFSLISAGTEKSSVTTAQASLLGKAKKRPDLVKQVIDNYHREGLMATINKVKNRLDNYKELGYSSAGVVIESSTEEFKPGDLVSCSGAGYASHAEVIYVPKNLVAKVPENVSMKEAAFGTVGAIAMQGIRQAQLSVGENVVVIGLGLLGQLTIQIANAMGCNTIGIDISSDAIQLAKENGADFAFLSKRHEVENKVLNSTKGIGADAVIITAATLSNEPIELAADILRDRGRIVIVGAIKADIPRSPFYDKEIEIRFSRSYGPGRYDSIYEEKGIDYPLGYVRFTEQRNVISFLELIGKKKVNVNKLITHIFPIEKGIEAYELITGKKKEKFLGVLISYGEEIETKTKLQNHGIKNTNIVKGKGISFIGAGNFAQSYLLPFIDKNRLRLVSTTNPINAKSVAKKFDFSLFSTSPDDVFLDDETGVIFIATRHNTHAKFVIKGLQNNKHIFVEKPLCVKKSELNEIIDIYNEKKHLKILVGFNRRFSEPIKKMKEILDETNGPKQILYRVNAGFVPLDSWYQQPEQGYRIFSEGGHFIDVMQFLTEAQPVSVFAKSIKSNNSSIRDIDTTAVTISFSDGSVGTLLYVSNGSSKLPKEYIEVSSDNISMIMNNFKEVILYRNKKIKFKFDGKKGHQQEVKTLINAIDENLDSPIEFSSIVATTKTTFAIIDSIMENSIINIL